MIKPLIFREDKSFTIMQLTDIHWVDGTGDDKRTRKLMELLLEKETPDLVVFTGDLVFSDKNLEQLEHAVKPVTDKGLPWAYVFGNHDWEKGAGRDELCARARELPGCLMDPGPEDLTGVGNYTLRLEDGCGNLCWMFYFLDSGAYNANCSVGTYDYIHLDQVMWYVQTVRTAAMESPEHSSLAFFHIPLPEYRDVWYFRPCAGHALDEFACAGQNSGMFSAMLEMGNMRGVFVGHDHINDFAGDLHSIRLCYGRAGGYNTYGKRGFRKGCRMIRLCSDLPSSFISWIQLDDGSVDLQEKVHKPKGKMGEKN